MTLPLLVGLGTGLISTFELRDLLDSRRSA